MKIYIASKANHANKWVRAKFDGHEIVSRWHSKNRRIKKLSDICIEDAKSCDILYIYTEPGEVPKGSLVEMGLALALGKIIVMSGPCEGFNETFMKHDLVTYFENHDHAVKFIEGLK